MRIVYICYSIIPSRSANSIQVMKMCQAFARQGHKVLLIAPNRTGELDDGRGENVYSYYGISNCFDIIRLPMLSFKGRKTLYGVMSAIKAKQFNPDLVYGRFLQGCYYSALIGLSVAYEIHKPLKGKSGEEMLYKMLNKRNLLKLVAITRALGNFYRDKYDLIEGKLKIAPDAADPPSVFHQYNKNNQSNRPKAGYAGHLYPGKGMELISEMVKRCPQVDFHIVGGTEKDIMYWKDHLKSYGNVIFHGFVSHSMIGRHLQAFDILLAPYQEKVLSYGGGSTDISRWMSPLKLFEYMAACKPIISSDLPVLREVIKNDENAILCPPNDIDSWENALTLLIKDPDYAKKLAVNAYSDFMKYYTWDVRVNNILSSIESIRNKLKTKQG